MTLWPVRCTCEPLLWVVCKKLLTTQTVHAFFPTETYLMPSCLVSSVERVAIAAWCTAQCSSVSVVWRIGGMLKARRTKNGELSLESSRELDETWCDVRS